ncbi:hypothetical protein AB835_11820 [Candidatus Endobugula sertula]|uniref:Uncharacterized protein n=1 Tax=Candidatus Endobugula sertula TaxID=62101 RepID=A0A1D2QMT1_9GAMM|nr:hypothetical protein AB835_11820 [Candidatus Endobugula sertula]
MNNRKITFIAIVGVVFVFAAYNLANYFQTQQVEQERQEQIALEQKLLAEEARRQKALEDEAKRLELEKQKQELLAQQVAEAERLEQEKLAAAKAAKQAELEQQQQRELAYAEERLKKAREQRRIEGLRDDVLKKLTSLSPRYITDHPDEFLDQDVKAMLFARNPRGKLVSDKTNFLMVYAAISQNLEVLQALLDIGININEANKAGYTPLHFASAYNTPEVINFLIKNDADTKAVAYIKDANALHLASGLNHNPESIKTLVNAGLPTDKKAGNYTPLLIAAEENSNLEIAGVLAQLGADTSVYNEQGMTPYVIVKSRIDGDVNSQYTELSDMTYKSILESLK